MCCRYFRDEKLQKSNRLTVTQEPSPSVCFLLHSSNYKNSPTQMLRSTWRATSQISHLRNTSMGAIWETWLKCWLRAFLILRLECVVPLLPDKGSHSQSLSTSTLQHTTGTTLPNWKSERKQMETEQTLVKSKKPISTMDKTSPGQARVPKYTHLSGFPELWVWKGRLYSKTRWWAKACVLACKLSDCVRAPRWNRWCCLIGSLPSVCFESQLAKDPATPSHKSPPKRNWKRSQSWAQPVSTEENSKCLPFEESQSFCLEPLILQEKSATVV